MRSAVLAPVLVVAIVGCGEAVDDVLPADYATTFEKKLEIAGYAPGHSDSYRIVYVDPITATAPRDLPTIYPLGATIVKEIRENVDGAPGDLRYIAIMRKVSEPASALDDEAGWLFTQADAPGGPETYRALCWARCHAAAPYLGAWYDYRD